MSHVVKSVLARRDLIEHYFYIAADKIDPAERFLTVAEESFERLAKMPGIGRAWNSNNPRLTGMRVYPLPQGYRSYLVFYRQTDDGIEVFRVLHGARDVGSVLDEMIPDDDSASP